MAERRPATTDEDLFVAPTSWSRYRLPRRDDPKVKPYKPAGQAGAAVRRSVEKYRQVLEDSFRLPDSDPEVGARGLAYLAGEAADDAFAAASLARLITGLGHDDTAGWRDFVDRWLTDHGLPFAARAVLELTGVWLGADDGGYTRSYPNPKPIPIRRTPAGKETSLPADAFLAPFAPVRAALAGAPQEVYAATVDVLAGYRDRGPYQRVATSFLDPTRVDWVDVDTAEVARLGHPSLAVWMVAAVNTAGEAARVVGLPNAWNVLSWWHLPTTFALALGPAAVDGLLTWHNGAYDRKDRQRLLAMVAVLPGDHAFQVLLAYAGDATVRPILMEMGARFPRRALRLLAESDPATRPWVGDLLRAHLAVRPDLVAEVLPELSPEAADRVRVATSGQGVRQAPPEAVPDLLAEPPWERPGRRAPVVEHLTAPDESTVRWREGERDEWYQPAADDRDRAYWEKQADEQAKDQLWRRSALDFFQAAPEDLARPLVGAWRPDSATAWLYDDEFRAMVGRFGADALPMLLHCVPGRPADNASLLMPFADSRVAVLMAGWSAGKRTRSPAVAWLTRHPDVAARALVPTALGRPGPTRRQAEAVLRMLVEAGHAETVRLAAHGYGPEAAAGIEDLLTTGALYLFPAKIPAVPDWAAPALLPPVRLAGDAGALPPDAVRNVLTMLAMSEPGRPYAGVPVVVAACSRDDLAEFGWALFERWREVGMPAKESWALHALAWLGDDGTVRRLSPVIQAWPGEGGHARAVAALDVLSTIGTDVALMHLHRIAQKAKFAGLKGAATQKITEVATALGLTAEQLADRLVPDFGLDTAGTLALDYGPRQFVVGFDEQLKPYVTDGAGKRLKALPKPGVKDDPEVAPAAYQRFTGLKKDVRAVAADQIHRFEQAMLWQRRWTVADFRSHLVDHPLVRHVVRRLVWTVHDPAGAPTGALRIAEDGSFADVHDESFVLADDALVGVAHPVHLGDDLPGWAETFADYQILQPFPQLGREVRRLTDEERTAARLARYEGVTVPVGRVLGLTRHGWELSAPEDAGMQNSVLRPAPGGLYVVVDLDPGVATGAVDMFPEQKFTSVRIDRYGSRYGEGREPVRFGDLDPATASEILHDLDEVTR